MAAVFVAKGPKAKMAEREGALQGLSQLEEIPGPDRSSLPGFKAPSDFSSGFLCLVAVAVGYNIAPKHFNVILNICNVAYRKR